MESSNLDVNQKYRISVILKTVEQFQNEMKKTYNNSPDLVFMFAAYNSVFNVLNKSLMKNEFIDPEKYREEIFNLDSAIFAWTQNLPHRIPSDSERQNDVGNVLFGALQAIEEILNSND